MVHYGLSKAGKLKGLAGFFLFAVKRVQDKLINMYFALYIYPVLWYYNNER